MAHFNKIINVTENRSWVAIILGVLFSFLVWKITTFEFRYALAITGAVLFLSLAMVFVYYLDEFLVYAFVFIIPFSIFGKWMFAIEVAVPARGISIGLPELMLLLAYFLWFCQIFVTKKEPLPKLNKVDALIFLLIFSQLISMFGAPNKQLALFDIIYNIKYILIYFFIVHKIKRKYLSLIIALFLLAIAIESPIAFYERLTGNVGIASAKGNVQSEDFANQGKVPGVENEIRGSGTTIDPHSLGLYYSMILPISFVFMMSGFLRPFKRVLIALIFMLGVGGLIITFSRSGWLSFASSTILALSVIFLKWKEGRSLIILMALILAGMPFIPKAFQIIDLKLFNAPEGLMETRYDMVSSALNIWKQNIFFGYGPGNYIEAITDPSIRILGHDGAMSERPIHNAYLWLVAEKGIFGFVSFYGIIFLAVRRCFKLINSNDRLIRILALAILCGLVGYLLDGLTNMMFREATPYAQLWVFLGISMALHRMQEKGEGEAFQ
ncbi:MAG: O-antigen ligase family protein [Candidatus Scalindua rubra]|uniref:O-antigen ligase-related domain-containing protein n=1 Tax=Candidatus Scalindua brodae TaxID=237368 RepID=A0A0B0EQ98_9BACT|nr:MAG: hypothetical protein SCABRO_00923 [Candidatus Scalindua brodae]MBZ0109943.1 O-antigen ligase family protein [Candidatus Scalindua rubra]TWU35483.1 O-Antigen ligase [Candidatus Brocadiaceae bacterium S225]